MDPNLFVTMGRESPMSPEKRKLLTVHEKHYKAMAIYVRECSDEELSNLLDACFEASSSNVAWSAYEAAQFLKREAQSEINSRHRRAAKADRVSTKIEKRINS